MGGFFTTTKHFLFQEKEGFTSGYLQISSSQDFYFTVICVRQELTNSNDNIFE